MEVSAMTFSNWETKLVTKAINKSISQKDKSYTKIKAHKRKQKMEHEANTKHD